METVMPSHEALLLWVASSSSMPAPGLLSIIRQSAGVPNGANVESAVVGSKPQTVDILEVEIDRADLKSTRCAADALNSTFGGPIANPIGGRSIRLLDGRVVESGSKGSFGNTVAVE